MDPMEILYTLWFIILPVIGILALIFGPIFWFFIVPGLAKMLTWNRFKNVTFHLIGDHTGYAELVPTKEQLPESITRTKKGWHFNPSPIYANPSKSETDEQTEQIGLKKYILKGIGKPIWLNFAGKITSMNFGALATLQQNKKEVNLEPYFDGLKEIIADTPKHFKKPLTTKLNALQKVVKSKPLTYLDLGGIKTALPQMYPPSLIDALATNREMKGMKRRGKELIPLILGATIILSVVAIIIVAILVLGG